MLPSGYLVRPCDGGGSIIHIVDHLNLEVNFQTVRLFIFFIQRISYLFNSLFQAWTVPEVLRPLYESSKVVAQKITIAVSIYIYNNLIHHCMIHIRFLLIKSVVNYILEIGLIVFISLC